MAGGSGDGEEHAEAGKGLVTAGAQGGDTRGTGRSGAVQHAQAGTGSAGKRVRVEAGAPRGEVSGVVREHDVVAAAAQREAARRGVKREREVPEACAGAAGRDERARETHSRRGEP